MGRRYLKYSDRKPTRLRHLKRSWPATGITGVDAANIGTPVRAGAAGAWSIPVLYGAPKVNITYSIVLVGVTTATGVEDAPTTIAATGTANNTSAQVATAIATALNANAAIVSTASGSVITVSHETAGKHIARITVTGAPASAIVPTGDEPEPEVVMAAPVVEKKSKKKA